MAYTRRGEAIQVDKNKMVFPTIRSPETSNEVSYSGLFMVVRVAGGLASERGPAGEPDRVKRTKIVACC